MKCDLAQLTNWFTVIEIITKKYGTQIWSIHSDLENDKAINFGFAVNNFSDLFLD